MATTLTVAPIGLGSATSVFSLKQSVRRSRAGNSLIRATCSSSGSRCSIDALHLFQDASKHLTIGAERVVQNTKESEVGKALAPIAASAALYMQAAGPAFAEVAEAAPVEMVDDSQYWWEVLLTSGAAGILYLVVFPPETKYATKSSEGYFSKAVSAVRYEWTAGVSNDKTEFHIEVSNQSITIET